MQDPSAEREPSGTAGGDEGAHRQLGATDLRAAAPGQSRAEDRPEQDDVGGEGESLERRREHEPARTRGGQLVADLSEPRREQDDPEQDGEREESLTSAM